MTTTILDTHVVTDAVVQYCPLCRDVLDPETDLLLCPECEADQAEKWADHSAERQQAWLPL